MNTSIERIFDLLKDGSNNLPANEAILDFVAENCPHQQIGRAYDEASKIYDKYVLSEGILLSALKKIALGIGKEATEECRKIVQNMLGQAKEGIVLDMPAGTGAFTFDEYVKHPDILFVAADYSIGMLKKAEERIKKLKAENIVLVRADVGALPFKSEMFDAVLCLNGIHSFPEKEKAIAQMARVLKKDKKIHGSLILRGERLLTDLVLELAYYRLLWFTKPALSRQELIDYFERNELKFNSLSFLKSAAAFEAVKT